MKGPNDFCINYEWGCMWGDPSSYEEVDKIAKKEKVEFLGCYQDRNTKAKYAVFHTVAVNYLVEI